MRNFQTLHTGCLFLQLYDRTTAPTVMGSSVLCPQLSTHRTDSLLPHTEGLYNQSTTLRLKDWWWGWGGGEERQGCCPNQESNRQPFDPESGALTTEPTH